MCCCAAFHASPGGDVAIGSRLRISSKRGLACCPGCSARGRWVPPPADDSAEPRRVQVQDRHSEFVPAAACDAAHHAALPGAARSRSRVGLVVQEQALTVPAEQRTLQRLSGGRARRADPGLLAVAVQPVCGRAGPLPGPGRRAGVQRGAHRPHVAWPAEHVCCASLTLNLTLPCIWRPARSSSDPMSLGLQICALRLLCTDSAQHTIGYARACPGAARDTCARAEISHYQCAVCAFAGLDRPRR